MQTNTTNRDRRGPSGATHTWHIGTIPIHGDLILAPMAGFSDMSFRRICREMGSAISYTPCVVDRAVLAEAAGADRTYAFHEDERPVAIQLLSRDPNLLVAAARRLMAFEPDLIDLNLGCPSRRITSGGRGAALLRQPQRIGQLVAALVESVPIPVTAKIRLGWDDASRNYLEVARILEDAGASAIAVHARTKAQNYAGHADWGAIAAIVEAVDVPVIGNGDVRSVSDIADMKAQTGCNAVMIGRGAIGNPWIFARRDLSDVSLEERLRVVSRHVSAMASFYGPRHGTVCFRKHLVKYIRGLPGAAQTRAELMRLESPEEVMATLRAWYETLASRYDSID
ncbi:MAG: tRNA dihydrouridine synthase DusB [Anaerolineae bacterium]